MAEYLAVEYNGLYNSNKQNTEYLDPPIIANVVSSPTKPLTDEQQNAQDNADEKTQLALTAEQEASVAQTLATLAQTAVEDALTALSLASPEELATAQLAYDEAVRLAQEAQVRAEQAQTLAEQAQLLAEEAVTNANNLTSTIDELRFNTLGCDIYKPTYPLKMITTFEPPFKTTHKAEERTFIKIDKDRKYTNITATLTNLNVSLS
jgi:multidrug efflux pump subunit AcrA (membrane-fusion protein)